MQQVIAFVLLLTIIMGLILSSWVVVWNNIHINSVEEGQLCLVSKESSV
jgi:hypothetical protein